MNDFGQPEIRALFESAPGLYFVLQERDPQLASIPVIITAEKVREVAERPVLRKPLDRMVGR